MPDLEKLNHSKERIVSTIRLKGPSLPIHIARALNVEPIFASAFLSELKSEEKIKVSEMKVGSSPLYFLPGQEAKLENFTNYLNSREKEAFNLLKKSGILEDDSQAPVTRVALRSIKDFAIPIKVRIAGESKIFWKHFLIPDSEIPQLIQNTLNPSQEKKEELKTIEPPKEIQKQPEPQKIAEEKIPEKEEQKQLVEKKETIKINKPKQKEHTFPKNIKDYLKAKDIEFLETLEEKKKELTAKIRTDTIFGKQSYLLIAKEKKKISPDDLTIALQKAQAEKMPALFISPGELDKKAAPHLKEWNNLIKFERIKL